MNYQIKASSVATQDAVIHVKQSQIHFGISPQTAETLANPAEIFLASFAACILKNVERFSSLMNFDYSQAQIEVSATRLEKPPRMESINYHLVIHSQDNKLNTTLLQKNIEKFGTIYNTVKLSCSITGSITKIDKG